MGWGVFISALPDPFPRLALFDLLPWDPLEGSLDRFPGEFWISSNTESIKSKKLETIFFLASFWAWRFLMGWLFLIAPIPVLLWFLLPELFLDPLPLLGFLSLELFPLDEEFQFPYLSRDLFPGFWFWEPFPLKLGFLFPDLPLLFSPEF